MDDATAPVVAKDSGSRKSIIGGLISGVIVLLFIQPILGFAWRFILSNIKYLNDAGCGQAALGHTDRYGFLFHAYLCLMIIAIALVNMMFPWLVGHPGAVKVLEKRIVRIAMSKSFATILFLIALLTNCASTVMDWRVLQMNASFQQRLAVLAPKISDQEYKELLAAWAAMKNSEDYHRIADGMTAEASTGGVALPDFLPGAAP